MRSTSTLLSEHFTRAAAHRTHTQWAGKELTCDEQAEGVVEIRSYELGVLFARTEGGGQVHGVSTERAKGGRWREAEAHPIETRCV